MRNSLFKTLSVSLFTFSTLTFCANQVMAQEMAPDAVAGEISMQAPFTSVQVLPASNVVMGTTVYTFKFTPATTGTVKTVEIQYPAAFTLTNAKLIEAAGIGDGVLTVAAPKLIYTVTAPVSIPAGTLIKIMAGGIVNAGITATNTHSISVTTKDAGGLIIDGPLPSANVLLTPVKLGMLGGNAVNSSKIVDGSVATADIADGAITSAKIAVGAIAQTQLSNDSVWSNNILDGQVSIADLGFDPATQTELDAHKTSTDHDTRYPVKTDLSTPGTINTITNPMDWTKLKGVPAGFADGIDNTGGTTTDVVCTGCVGSTDIADAGIANVDLAVGSYPNITGVGTLASLNVGTFALPYAAGRIASTGASNELTFVKRTLTSWPSLVAAGDRYVLYNPDGNARLFTDVNGDLMTFTKTGQMFFKGGLTPTGGTTLPAGFMSNDAAFFVPTNDGGANSDLRLYILDDPYDRFTIWGDSCGGGDCWNMDAASTAHSFDAAGNVYHKGRVSIGAYLYPDSILSVKDSANNGGNIRVGANAVDTTVEKRIRFGDGDYVAIGEQVGKDDALDIKGRTGIYLDTSSGLFFPNSYPARAEAQGGNVISFGHPGHSEDQIYYSDNTFHFRDSPGGGDTSEPVIEVGAIRIIGGADLAEPFNIRNSEEFRPGMVVAIDPDHIGGMRIADKSYDQTVAGVISGANGLNPGLVMVKEGMTDKDSAPVALTGRVYTYVDASYGAVKPGDLLTTSDTPGHAMKATDYNKAHGAIIGKAMSTLTEGKGLVLVLVSLQ